MATEVILPRVDMDMAEGKVAHWYVKDGETVSKGQVLFEIETDKATMEVDAPVGGVIFGIRGEIGVSIPVGEVIGWILEPGEAAPAAANSAASASVATAPDARPQPATAAPEAAKGETDPGDATLPDAPLLRATPLARSLARQHGLALDAMAGSGPNGRVLGSDVLAALASAGPAGSASTAGHDLHLHWARRGSGVPLLLIHGFGADQGGWRPLLQHLPAGQAVIAIDLPNHGKSVARDVNTLQEVAQQVLQRLDAEGIAAFHLLGHSLGGGVALAMVQERPQRVRSLTLLAPAGLGPDINAAFIDGLISAGDEATLKAAMTPLFHDPAGLTGSFVATAHQQLQAPGRRAALARMAQQLMPQGRQSQSLRHVLEGPEGLRVPAQMIWGRRDRIIPMQHALDAPTHVSVHLLAQVGHLPQVEAPALVAALVNPLLNGAAGPS